MAAERIADLHVDGGDPAKPQSVGDQAAGDPRQTGIDVHAMEAACDLIRLRTDSRHSRGDGRKERGAACGGIKHGSFLEVEPVLDGQVKHSVCQIGRGEIGGLVAPHLGRE